jgi:hypothetical protein
VRDEKGEIWKPMWLIVIGKHHNDLDIYECYEAYRQRYDLEHLFRFGKQRLLMNAIKKQTKSKKEKMKVP